MFVESYDDRIKILNLRARLTSHRSWIYRFSYHFLLVITRDEIANYEQIGTCVSIFRYFAFTKKLLEALFGG